MRPPDAGHPLLGAQGIIEGANGGKRMLFRLARTALSVLCLSLPVAALAADLIPVEDFARHAELSSPHLSPDGQYLALRMDDNSAGSHSLMVFRVDNMTQPISVLRMPKYELPANIHWVSPTRLVIEKGRVFGSIDIPQSTGELIATDIDGKNQDYLYGYDATAGKRSATRSRDRGWASVVGIPEKNDGHFYLSENLWDNDNLSSVYEVDATKGSRRLAGDISVGNMRFFVGSDGIAHYAFGNNNDFNYVVYHREASGWAKLSGDLVGSYFEPVALTPDHKHVYAFYSADGGPESLVEQDENGGDRRVLAQDPFGEVTGMQFTPHPREPFAVSYRAGVPKPVYINPDLPAAKLHMALSQKFPGEVVNFINYSQDGKQLLFSVYSDRDPGSYFLIDTTNYKVRKLFASVPWIDPNKMASRRPVRFKASDGTELEAILTIPRNVDETNLPMVLLPHGGPFGISDGWSYDYLSQFLASRGYLVLQVNFRGSGGRGVNFQHAGYKQWGGRIQQDLIDGVKWAIGESYADPKRVCVFGASFGGYSAMMAPIRAPGMFKCAVGYAGVYDLKMMYDHDVSSSKFDRSFFDKTLGKDPAELAANSPDKLADKIDIPVFLVHGEDDQVALFAQAKAMRAALDAAHKPYEWLSKPSEGHGFYDEKNNVEFYTRLAAFLAKNIGPDASASH